MCSKQFFSRAAKFPMTYYGQLAFNKINPGGNFELKDQSFFDKEYEKEFKKNKLIRHLILLKELNATQLGKDIFKHLADLNIDKGSEVLAAELATNPTPPVQKKRVSSGTPEGLAKQTPTMTHKSIRRTTLGLHNSM